MDTWTHGCVDHVQHEEARSLSTAPVLPAPGIAVAQHRTSAEARGPAPRSPAPPQGTGEGRSLAKTEKNGSALRLPSKTLISGSATPDCLQPRGRPRAYPGQREPSGGEGGGHDSPYGLSSPQQTPPGRVSACSPSRAPRRLPPGGRSAHPRPQHGAGTNGCGGTG